MSLFFQFLPIFILFLHRTYFNLGPIAFVFISLAFAFPLQRFEISLSSAGLQFILSLSCAVILVSPVGARGTRYFSYFVLLLAGLSGPPSVFLAPLFFLRAVRDRSVGRFLQTGIIAFCGFVQVAYIAANGLHQSRGTIGFDGVVSALTLKLVLIPLKTKGILDLTRLKNDLILGTVPAGDLAFIYGILAVFVLLLCFLVWKARRVGLGYLLLAIAALATLSIIGSLEGFNLISQFAGSRYFYAPSILIVLLAILALSRRQVLRSPIGILLVLFVAVVLWNGGWTAPPAPSFWKIERPTWRQEMAELRENPFHSVRIAPAGWTIGYGMRANRLAPIRAPAVDFIPLSGDLEVRQRFECRLERAYSLAIRTVNWGAQQEHYRVRWRLSEVGQENRPLEEGFFETSFAGDWTEIELPIRPIIPCRGRVFEVAFSVDRPYQPPLGFPVFSNSGGQLGSHSVKVNGADLKGMGLGIRLSGDGDYWWAFSDGGPLGGPRE